MWNTSDVNIISSLSGGDGKRNQRDMGEFVVSQDVQGVGIQSCSDDSGLQPAGTKKKMRRTKWDTCAAGTSNCGINIEFGGAGGFGFTSGGTNGIGVETISLATPANIEAVKALAKKRLEELMAQKTTSSPSTERNSIANCAGEVDSSASTGSNKFVCNFGMPVVNTDNISNSFSHGLSFCGTSKSCVSEAAPITSPMFNTSFYHSSHLQCNPNSLSNINLSSNNLSNIGGTLYYKNSPMSVIQNPSCSNVVGHDSVQKAAAIAAAFQHNNTSTCSNAVLQQSYSTSSLYDSNLYSTIMRKPLDPIIFSSASMSQSSNISQTSSATGNCHDNIVHSNSNSNVLQCTGGTLPVGVSSALPGNMAGSVPVPPYQGSPFISYNTRLPPGPPIGIYGGGAAVSPGYVPYTGIYNPVMWRPIPPNMYFASNMTGISTSSGNVSSGNTNLSNSQVPTSGNQSGSCDGISAEPYSPYLKYNKVLGEKTGIIRHKEVNDGDGVEDGAEVWSSSVSSSDEEEHESDSLKKCENSANEFCNSGVENDDNEGSQYREKDRARGLETDINLNHDGTVTISIDQEDVLTRIFGPQKYEEADADFTQEIEQLDNGLFTADVDINFSNSRNRLVRKDVLQEIRLHTGAAIISRGRYKADANGIDKGLHLRVTADSKEKVKNAGLVIAKLMQENISNINIRGEYNDENFIDFLRKMENNLKNWLKYIMKISKAYIELRGTGNDHPDDIGSSQLVPPHVAIYALSDASRMRALSLSGKLIDYINKQFDNLQYQVQSRQLSNQGSSGQNVMSSNNCISTYSMIGLNNIPVSNVLMYNNSVRPISVTPPYMMNPSSIYLAGNRNVTMNIVQPLGHIRTSINYGLSWHDLLTDEKEQCRRRKEMEEKKKKREKEREERRMKSDSPESSLARSRSPSDDRRSCSSKGFNFVPPPSELCTTQCQNNEDEQTKYTSDIDEGLTKYKIAGQEYSPITTKQPLVSDIGISGACILEDKDKQIMPPPPPINLLKKTNHHLTTNDSLNVEASETVGMINDSKDSDLYSVAGEQIDVPEATHIPVSLVAYEDDSEEE